MAKLKAGRLARELSDACLQYWGNNNTTAATATATTTSSTITSTDCKALWPTCTGGMGYIDSTGVTRAFRDLRLISIGGGADEVMLGILAKIKAKEMK